MLQEWLTNVMSILSLRLPMLCLFMFICVIRILVLLLLYHTTFQSTLNYQVHLIIELLLPMSINRLAPLNRFTSYFSLRLDIMQVN